jgi:hypothetical protein
VFSPLTVFNIDVDVLFLFCVLCSASCDHQVHGGALRWARLFLAPTVRCNSLI